MGNKECKRVLEVSDLIAETTLWYPTFHRFAEDHGFNTVSIANHYRIHPEKPFNKRYIFKENI